MDLIIRPFQSSDTSELWQLHERTVLASGFSIEVVKRDTDLHFISENYEAKGGYFVVALVRDKIVGMGGYRPLSAAAIEIKRMRVHPDFQHAGIGTAILKALEVKSMQSGFAQARLDTANADAQPFYQRNGYRFVRSESEGELRFNFFEKELKA